MDKSILIENSHRMKKFRKSGVDERFMANCNDALKQSPLPEDVHERDDLPFIFVVGPPRSGTTLAMQLLAHCLNVGYVNNIMARFWGAPVHGARLSNMMVAGQMEISFVSRFGVTPSLTDPHEFGYFWSHWLGSRDKVKTREQVAWDELSRELRLLAGEFQRPLAFKNLLVGCHAEGMAAALPKTIFIRVLRDNLDNAISIARAREEYYNDRNRWWSLRSGYYAGLENQHWTEQIAHQLAGIRSMLNASMEAVNRFKSAQVVEVHYLSLCENPERFVTSVIKAGQALGDTIEKASPPPELTAKTGLNDESRRDMADALERCGLNTSGRAS